MKVLADESVDRQIVERLRQHHEVCYIAEVSPSVDDNQVLDRANQMHALLITSDKDFGELVYRQKLTHHGVVLLRLSGLASSIKADIVASVILEQDQKLAGAFSVINPNNVRIRTNAQPGGPTHRSG